MKIKSPTGGRSVTSSVPLIAPGQQGPVNPVAAVTPVEEARPGTLPTRELLQRTAEQLETFVRDNGRELEFQVGEESGEVVVVVRRSSTGEVLRTIPPDEALRLARELQEGGGALFSALA